MFEIFRVTAEYILVGLLLTLLLGPVAFYLRAPWAYRRQEILDGLSASRVSLYFKTFYSGMGDAARDFRRFYHVRFGRRRYIFPTLMLGAAGLIAST